eukprot:COSAG01_NODE_6645_length_3566_cov_2.581194_3_plen_143_part_00
MGEGAFEHMVVTDAVSSVLSVAQALRALLGCPAAAEKPEAVRRAFPSMMRSILTEIYPCHACSCHEILRVETAQEPGSGGTASGVPHAPATSAVPALLWGEKNLACTHAAPPCLAERPVEAVEKRSIALSSTCPGVSISSVP